MKTIQEAKKQLSKLVDQAAAGDEIIIAKAGKPMAKLVQYIPAQTTRKGGFLSGKIWESDDCWDSDPKLL